MNPKAKKFPLFVERRIVRLGLPKRVSNVPNNKLSTARPMTKLITRKIATPMAIKLVDTIYS